MSKKLIFSSFALKIWALVLMTIDHIGLLLITLQHHTYEIELISNIFRGFGRLALPLFVFMIVEGVIHTKSFKKYLLRLGIMAALICIFFICIEYINFGYDVSEIKGAGNIFLDLTLVAVTVYCLKQPKIWQKAFILLPLAISIISFCVKNYEISTKNSVLWYPSWLYLQYDWFSIILGIGFYYTKQLADLYINYISEKHGIDRLVFDESGTTQFTKNIIAFAVLFVAVLIHYLSGYLSTSRVFWDYNIQSYAVFAGVLLLFYNGKRGYNAKWFQYGCYLYYPLSIGILFLIYILIGG